MNASSDPVGLLWLAVVAAAISWACLWSYFRPDQNKLTRFVVKYFNRTHTRIGFLAPPGKTLALGILFGCMALVAVILAVFRVELPAKP